MDGIQTMGFSALSCKMFLARIVEKMFLVRIVENNKINACLRAG